MAYKPYKSIPLILVFLFMYAMVDSVEVFKELGFISKVEMFYNFIIYGDLDSLLKTFFASSLKVGSALLISYFILCLFNTKPEKA